MTPEHNTGPEEKPRTAVSPAKLAANRANSLLSTGPRTREGKEKSRLNNLIHGLRSELPVIPGEDGAALDRRLEVWTDELGAETEAERYMVKAAVHASWRMDRCRDVEAAALSGQIIKAEEGSDDLKAGEVGRLVERLHEDPADVVRQLRQSSLGCLWLIGRWTALADRLQAWKCVNPTERREAIHLMGKQMTELFTDPFVRRWNAAYLGAYLGDARSDVDRIGKVLGADYPEEMSQGEFINRVKLMSTGLPDKDGGHALLKQYVGEAIAELSERRELIEIREERDRALTVKCAAFDASASGASRLRYEMSHDRALHAALRDLRTMQAIRYDQAASAAAPTEANATVAGAAAAPTEATAAAPTEANIAAPTEANVAAPTEANVAAPTEANVAAPTEANAAAPTEANAVGCLTVRHLAAALGAAPGAGATRTTTYASAPQVADRPGGSDDRAARTVDAPTEARGVGLDGPPAAEGAIRAAPVACCSPG